MILPCAKHIALKYHHFCQHIKKGYVLIQHLPTVKQIRGVFANLFLWLVFSCLYQKLIGWWYYLALEDQHAWHMQLLHACASLLIIERMFSLWWSFRLFRLWDKLLLFSIIIRIWSWKVGYSEITLAVSAVHSAFAGRKFKDLEMAP